MKQRIYFPERSKSIVVAEGYASMHSAQNAVDLFLTDVSYNEEPESGFHYTREKPCRQDKKKERIVFSISSH
ncbi:hypothetical protein [Deminuibacter soli]|uniref:Uncharacterized protein n=1 Tax=Deminuibacter soli TaxID=2291815 RepID=A0A3E1NKE2_9BACT|nr:hypothetical protein [Deminuibacter soli]RFM28248.1 hypothetical protein DXN05_12090 [Deminuibacter soli]